MVRWRSLIDSSELQVATALWRKPAYVNVQLRGLSAFQHVHEMIRDGIIGRVYNMELRERTSTFRGSRVVSWQERRSTGGGRLFAMGPHLLDLALFLVGRKYNDVLRNMGKFRTAKMTPRGSWIEDLKSESDLADEAFSGMLDIGGCWLNIFTTSIGAGPRTLEFDIEGTEAMVRFAYQDGCGRLRVHTELERLAFVLVEGGELRAVEGEEVPARLNSSIFRVAAFTGYASAIVDALTGSGSGEHLASL